ncbi:MAG: hypothetical protein AB4038_02545 [Prochloraceae cyanobacterium]
MFASKGLLPTNLVLSKKTPESPLEYFVHFAGLAKFTATFSDQKIVYELAQKLVKKHLAYLLDPSFPQSPAPFIDGVNYKHLSWTRYALTSCFFERIRLTSLLEREYEQTLGKSGKLTIEQQRLKQLFKKCNLVFDIHAHLAKMPTSGRPPR